MRKENENMEFYKFENEEETFEVHQIEEPFFMRIAVDNCKIPSRAHKNDAGLDLYAKEGGWIFPFSRRTFNTGCRVQIPEGFFGLLTSKSGMMSKQGITSRGTIDSGFTGSIKAVLFNHSWKFVKIEKGQKVSQLVLIPIITPELELVDELEETERSDGGFGSTGK